MDERIAVTFRGGRHHEFRSAAQCRFQGFKSSIGTYAQGCDAVRGVVHRAGWTGEVENVIKRAPFDGLTNIFLDKFKSRVVA